LSVVNSGPTDFGKNPDQFAQGCPGDKPNRLWSTSHKVSILVICSRSDEALARRTSAFCRAAACWGKSLSITEMFIACLPCCSTRLSSRLSRCRVPESVVAMWFPLSTSFSCKRRTALLGALARIVCRRNTRFERPPEVGKLSFLVNEYLVASIIESAPSRERVSGERVSTSTMVRCA